MLNYETSVQRMNRNKIDKSRITIEGTTTEMRSAAPKR